MTVIATGGLADLFDKHTGVFDAIEPDLTIQGLSLLYDMAARRQTMIPGEELIFLALGGSGEIGMNVNLYGCRGQWIMVDLGLTFADFEFPGIDLILPDLEFIEDQQERLVGIVLTHGHEDHIGALPYLAEDLKAPLYATPFTAGLIAGKLEEEGLTGQVKLNIVERGGTVELGPFKVSFVALSHSIPEGNGLLIETPFGNIFHTGDWKIDETPVIGEAPSTEVLTRIGDAGVLALVCDSTNVFQDKPSGSEESVHAGLLAQVAKAKGRVLVTTFASNAARLQTIGRVGARNRTQGVHRRPLARAHPARRPGDRLSEGFPAADLVRRGHAPAARGGADHRHRRAGRAARGARPDRSRQRTSSSWRRATPSSSRRGSSPATKSRSAGS